MHLFPIIPPFKLISALTNEPVAVAIYKLQPEASVMFFVVCESLSFHVIIWEEVVVTV